MNQSLFLPALLKHHGIPGVPDSTQQHPLELHPPSVIPIYPQSCFWEFGMLHELALFDSMEKITVNRLYLLLCK